MATVRNPAQPAVWQLTLYPTAGEASGSFRPSARRPYYVGTRGGAANPDRARAEAGRRARKVLRRYCCAHHLNRFWTLTFAGDGCHDPRQLRLEVAGFFRRLRKELGGQPFPYVWVPEWHKTHGLHVHLALGQFVPKGIVREAWGHGFVHAKLLGDLPVGSTSWDEARTAASYLAKYVSKTFDHDVQGRHRYEVGQGFQPPRIRLEGTTANAVLDQAYELMGRQIRRQWWSFQENYWPTEPAFWIQWA